MAIIIALDQTSYLFSRFGLAIRRDNGAFDLFDWSYISAGIWPDIAIGSGIKSHIVVCVQCVDVCWW